MMVDVSLSVAADSRGAQLRTKRAEEHEAGKGDDPKVGIEQITTIELEDWGLDTWMSDRSIEQRTDQKTIG